jgi:hypothetical protein
MAKTNPTIEYGNKLIDREGQQIGDWRTRELGLNIVLLGLAENYARRLSKLSQIVEMIEDKLIDESVIDELPPDRLLGLHRMSRESLDSSYGYIRQVLGSVNWSQFEAQLLTAQSEDKSPKSSTDQDVSRIAREILKNLRGDDKVIKEGLQ